MLPGLNAHGELTQMAAERNPLKILACAPLRILIVDDNRDIAETSAFLLTAAGHRVEWVVSGQAALDTVGSLQPHLVLLDLGLPGMDGYAVARQLRQTPSGRHVVVVAVSGYAQDAERLRAAGFNQHLLKPVPIEVLAGVIAAVSSSRSPQTPPPAAGDGCF